MLPAKILARSVRDVFAPYPHALLGKDRGIHRLRVGVRRLRMMLRLVALRPQGRRRRLADRRLRSIAGAVALSRDLDVAVELFELYPPLHEAGRGAWTALRHALWAARARSRRISRDRLFDLDIAKLRDDLRAIVSRAEVDSERLRARLQERAALDGSEVVNGLVAMGKRFKPEALHDVRRGVRRLRYLAEIDDAIVGRRSDEAKQLRLLQGRIGEIYDRHVFATWLASRGRPSAHPDRAARARAARSMARRVGVDARRLHRELLASDPMAVVLRTLEAMRPQETPSPAGNVVPFPPAYGQ